MQTNTSKGSYTNSQSQQLHTNTPQLRKHIRKASEDSQHSSGSRSKRSTKLWSQDEDQQLNLLYNQFNGNWRQISENLPGRNPTQCSQRFKKVHPNRSKVRKQWTDEEDKKVLEFVKKFGKNWKRIEFEMNGRTSKQIRERFINQLDTSINHGRFTESEDRMIYHLFIKYGPRWSDISKNLKGRPENMVKNRFYSYIKRVYMSEEDEMIEEFQQQKLKDEGDEDMEDYEDEDDEEQIEQSLKQEQIKQKMDSLQAPSKLDTIQSSNNTNGSESYRQKSSSSLALGAYNRNSCKTNEENQQMVIDSLESNKGPFQKNKNKQNESSFDEEQASLQEKTHYSFQPVPLPELFDQMNYMSQE